MKNYDLYLEIFDTMKQVISEGKWKKRTLINRLDNFLFGDGNAYRLNVYLAKATTEILRKHSRGYKIFVSFNGDLAQDVFGSIWLLRKRKCFKIWVDARKFINKDNVHNITNDIIRTMAQILVHEMVHYRQYTSNWQYFSNPRSKDRVEYSDDDYKTYLTDHLEIEAWAIDAAIDISMVCADFEVSKKILASGHDVLADISSNFEFYYSRKHNISKKLFQRYLKHIYKNLEK